MADELPTVRIRMPHESGDFAIINLSDFDPAVHVLIGDEPDPAPVTTVPAVTEAAASPAVSHETPAKRPRGRPRKETL